MLSRVDSFGRSSALEFSRSPLLERNDPPAVGSELSRNVISNDILGFGKFIDRDWVWYPLIRVKQTFGAEFNESITSVPTVSLNDGRPGNQYTQVTSISAGWNALFGTSEIISAITATRTQTEIVVGLSYRDPAGVQRFVTQRATLEGTPVDVRTLAGIFWSTCGLAAAPDRPPARTNFPVLYEVLSTVNNDGTISELSRGLRQPPPTQAFVDASIASSNMLANFEAPIPDGFIGSTLSIGRRRLLLSWARQIVHFTERGEIQAGSIDTPFVGNPAALSCERGYSEEYESAIPPLLSAARLDTFPTAITGFAETKIERRIIPPNATSIFLTC